MGDNKFLMIMIGIITMVLLPFIIVIALILGAIGGLDDEGEGCVAGPPAKSTFGFPTAPDKRGVKAGFKEGEHEAIDYDVPDGTEVLAASDGKVTKAGTGEIRIKHAEGIESRYKWLKESKVNEGDKVTKGQVIALSGSHDESDPGAKGQHLHFELWLSGDSEDVAGAIDPDSLMSEGSEGGSGCGCGGSGSEELVGSDNVQKAFNYFVGKGYTAEQSAGIVGNMMWESGVEPMRLQNTPPSAKTPASQAAGSSLGWGIVQWTPAGKYINAARRDGADDKKIESLEHQLWFLNEQLEGRTSSPEAEAGRAQKAAKTVEDATRAFGGKYERFGGHENPNESSWAKRIAFAKDVLGTNGGAGGCGGAGNGDIVATALTLAWKKNVPNSVNKSAATPAYQDAMPKYNGSTGTDEWSDCGVFVATVVVMSGVDPDYPRRGTGTQLPYLQNSPKWETIPFNDTSQLKPGDILIMSRSGGIGHTYIYTGKIDWEDGGNYNGVSASLHDRIPEPTTAQVEPNYYIARAKASAKP
ncbi:phage tail tip lysozyme [Kribbella sp. NBC_01245]|uniref:phage tail tip lysozyme n=1 Tax=Kribbella sp. NBC_01245 TaxID=2903578 RepID=UPI002E2B2676|nr:phage tail tip lysozyme [Kribbella sp. NBC_01245]